MGELIYSTTQVYTCTCAQMLMRNDSQCCQVTEAGGIHSIIPMACVHLCMYIQSCFNEEGRKKQARSNKQQGKATQHTQGSHFPKVHVAYNYSTKHCHSNRLHPPCQRRVCCGQPRRAPDGTW